MIGRFIAVWLNGQDRLFKVVDRLWISKILNCGAKFMGRVKLRKGPSICGETKMMVGASIWN